MSGRAAKAARRDQRGRMEGYVRQAHDQLHRGDVDAAHELLHGALGREAVELAVAPLSPGARFDDAFVRLCTAHGVRAAYIVIGGQRADGAARILAGGDAELCRFLDGRLRDET